MPRIKAHKKNKRYRIHRQGENKQMKVEKEGLQRKTLLAGALILATLTTFIMVGFASTGENGKSSLVSLISLKQDNNIEVKSEVIAERALKQKFQLHMQEVEQQAGIIPYVDVWVLNDPFFPLLGNPGVLIDNKGTLDSKLGKMLNRPDPESTSEGGGSTTTTTTTGAQGATFGNSSEKKGSAVLIEAITESRGIMYARIKIGSEIFDRVKAGSVISGNYKIEEFKDRESLILLCGDEKYEMKVGQLRLI